MPPRSESVAVNRRRPVPSAVDVGVECLADLLSPGAVESAEPRRGDRLGLGGKVVEGGRAVVIDTVIGPTGMQVGMSRSRVSGATTTSSRSGMRSSPETMRTGRRFRSGVSIGRTGDAADVGSVGHADDAVRPPDRGVASDGIATVEPWLIGTRPCGCLDRVGRDSSAGSSWNTLCPRSSWCW